MSELDIKVQVNFTEQTEYGEYSDSLYYTLDEYSLKTEADVLQDKQARLDSWLEKMRKIQAGDMSY